jgi:hypothetical protein
VALSGASEPRKHTVKAQLWQGQGGGPIDLTVISGVVELAVGADV